MMASAVLSLLGAALLSRWIARSGPARVVPIALVGNAALFVAEWTALAARPGAVAAALYLHVTALGPLLLSGFWSIVNERFDPHTAKRVVSPMAGAGALAGVAGGLAVERVASLVGIGWTLALLALASSGAALAVRGIGAPDQKVDAARGEEEAGPMSGLLGRYPLLAPMALLMVLGAAIDAFLDYALKAEAAAAWPETADLVRFFAIFYVATGLLAFALQLGLGTQLLRRFGLGGAMAVLPVGVIAAGAVSLVSARLWSVVLVRGVESVAASGLFRSGFELLYAPIPAAVKRPVKAWIDVSARSVGSIVGAGLVLFLLFVVPDLGSGLVVGLAMATAGFALVGVVRTDRAYVAQLGTSLRQGSVSLQEVDALDATTARTVAAAQTVTNRSSLLEEVRAYAAQRPDAEAEGAVEPSSPAESAGVDPAPDVNESAEVARAASQAVLARVAEITSGDPMRVRRALHMRPAASASSQERRVAAHVTPLLGVPSLARDADAFLRRLAPRAPGHLVDGLLDRSEGRDVRIALAGILSGVPDSRACTGLWLGLEDPDFGIRQACAEGAVRIVERRKDLAPPKEAVYARIEREIFASGPDAVPRPRTVEQVFTLLALLHGRETMRSTLTGVRSGIPTMRGTALELLESLLPPRLGQQVFALIEEAAEADPSSGTAS
jgi:hypothetical protein